MRPVRLSLEGFSAYREPVEADFAGVDFFSLTGPTGAGKSSLIDAMVFALYGRVPRLGGNLVAPAISAGADRARVRFDFEVGDTVYTAVRLAQRTSTGGASVREARLQQGDEVLADGADDVTGAVEDLLRLRFDDFTRTVVLPQGDFARFLTATKSERQGLLRSLLGLDVYTRVREMARTRAAVAGERADGAARALEGLDLVDADTLQLALERAALLDGLTVEVGEKEKGLSVLDRQVEVAEAEEANLSKAVADLSSIDAPDQLGELDNLMFEARSRLVDAEESEREGKQALAMVEAEVSGLPGTERIGSWKRDRERLAGLEKRLGDTSLEKAKAGLSEAEQALGKAVADLAEAELALATERSKHAAHALAAGLEVGEPCPVCLHQVGELPARDEPAELDGLDEVRNQAMSRVEISRSAADEARDAVARLEATRAELDAHAGELRSALAGAPDPDELEKLAIQRAELDAEVSDRRKTLIGLEEETARARIALEDLADASRRISRLLTAAQLKVAGLEPPVSESDDVVVQWKELLEWKQSTLGRLGEDVAAAATRVEEARKIADMAKKALAELLTNHAIPAVEPYSAQVAAAHEAARSVAESYQRALAQAEELTELERSAREEAAVAGALSGHLRADGFEQWMMAGALTELVTGANHLLGQLSSGGYSLASDDSGSFSIVDHRNADESRSVSTLSGGETFLVSLALALSLAETLSAKGGSGLDAIMLDEGFGTLDEESLDTVASVLEELTGRGLMVGIITHVKELAARAPVRYEVRREPTGAQVRLVS
ncbi:MAG TPA: SMC family ATPase [Acidimicrobiia bacterium]|nr:SMC family ATPase [Acidimicrobiia bacterium]